MKLGGNYLKTDDVKEGDVIKILDEGRWVESATYTYDDGKPKRSLVFGVDFKGEKRDMRMNKVSQDELKSAWGDDTADWIGKTAKVSIEYVRTIKKNMIVLTASGKEEAQKEIPEKDW